MGISTSIFVLILILTAGLAILKNKSKGYRYLFLFLILHGSHIILRLGMFYQIPLAVTISPFLFLPTSFFIGSMVLLYTKQILFNQRAKNLKLHFIVPGAAFLAHVLFSIQMPNYMTLEATMNFIQTGSAYIILMGLSLALYNVLLASLALKQISLSKRESVNIHSNSQRINSKWIFFFVVFNLLFFLLKGVVFYFGVINRGTPFLAIDDVIQFAALCLFFYFQLTKPELLPADENQSAKKYSKVSLAEDQRKRYRILLEDYMEEKKAFLDMNLSLSKISQELAVPKHLLSMTINVEFDQNFFNLVNGYPVRHAGELLKSREYKDESILAVAFAAGFQSKATFNRIFKSHFKVTPTEYRKNLSD